MFQPRDYVKRFVDFMNTKHSNIDFTSEIEDQNSFSYMAIKVTGNA